MGEILVWLPYVATELFVRNPGLSNPISAIPAFHTSTMAGQMRTLDPGPYFPLF